MGRRGNPNHKKRKQTAEPEIEERDLDRFAGSSGEDQESDSEDDNEEEAQKQVAQKQKVILSKTDGKNDKPGNDDGAVVEYKGPDDGDEDSDFEQYRQQPHHQQQQHEQGSAGMANAMARILGSTDHKKKSSTTTTTAVLSKTTTPLQRQLQKEWEQEKLLREKRHQKAINPLPALHIPLSVATSLPLLQQSNGNSVTRELEMERLHRRVATRGVVALFNAVAQHQTKSGSTNTKDRQPSNNEEVKKMTKHGFLDMIKTAAASATTDGKTDTSVHKQKQSPQQNKDSSSKPRWNALQDDFMLNPKTNWDQAEGSSEESAVGDEDLDLSGDEGPGNKIDGKATKSEKSRKKRKVSKQ